MSKLTLQQLENHLWGAADILRGAVDSEAYKHYIFGLLFYKRLCDVWEEEYENRLKAYNGDKEMAADPDEHRFDIPKKHFWKDVRKHTTDIGEHLNAAFRAIEDANMKLQGVFQDVDFNNKERFTDAVLESLLNHFEKYSLRNADVDGDMLGAAYEYLIAQFAETAGKKGGEFFTPKMVVRLIVECLQPQEGMTIYDPACGSGGMLLEAYHYLQRNKKNPHALALYGQEKNLNTWAIAKMNLFLHDIDDVDIARGDTLLDPKHLVSAEKKKDAAKGLMTFDRVFANPPFSLKQWGHSVWSKGDRFGRDKYGCPPKSYGDLAFVQHMIASLKSDGKLGVVLPHGILFRAGSEGKIRENMLKEDLIEGVIGLGSNLFYGAGIPACILIINKNKQRERKNKVLLINGAKELLEGRAQNYLTDDNIKRMAQTFILGKEKKGFSRWVPLKEIENNDFDLNIPRYVPEIAEEDQIDVKSELKRLEELRRRRDEAEELMIKYLKELGYAA